jgi:hypothetical protein
VGFPRGSDSLYVSDGVLRGILPLIPNLQFGYLYDFGNNRVNTGRFTADYLLPFTLSADSEVFGEAHTEFQDFWNTLKSVFASGTTNSTFNNRVDMSFGGGFRAFPNHYTLLGINGFYDTSRLGENWYSSGGLGMEMAALIGSDALDLNFNWYGQLFNGNVIRNAFRYGPSNFDFQAGYSHELWNGGPDLRLSATGYKFDIGNSVYGWNGGAELRSRDGVFVLRYNVGHDKVNETYQEVGGFVNIGFQLDNIFRGESPFTKPEPIFSSPRGLRYLLTRLVRRHWHQPGVIVVNRQGGSQGGSQGQGGSSCGNLDRFLASVTMTPTGSGGVSYNSFDVHFLPSVPHACLDPTKSIVVEFDFNFGTTPATFIDFFVAVGDITDSVFVNGFFGPINPPTQSGHVMTTLVPTQSAFTAPAIEPAVLRISSVTGGGTPGLTVTNVVIHFNQ